MGNDDEVSTLEVREHEVWGDIGLVATRLRERLPSEPVSIDQRSKLAERWRLWRDEKREREVRDRGHGIDSALIFKHLGEALSEDAILSVDVGNNTYSMGRYLECHCQPVIMSGYLGSIGFGFPAAMGAWAAAPTRPIVSISGDGGFAAVHGGVHDCRKARHEHHSRAP